MKRVHDENIGKERIMKRLLVVMLSVSVGVISVTTPRIAWAWGDEGHEIIAVIAYGYLTPEVRKRVDDLLAADQNDPLTAPDFMSRATWADKYRDSDRYSKKKLHYNATHLWHFVDTEIDDGSMDAACNNHPALPPGTPASSGSPDTCVVDKIEQFATELRNPSTAQAEKILALKFLMHFVGDVHQPLHAADHHDRGGNNVLVLFAHRTKPDKLHAYWDTHLVQLLGSDPKEVAATLKNQIVDSQAAEWSKGHPADWAKESFSQAKDVSYNFAGEREIVDDHGTLLPLLDAVYNDRSLPVVREQLSKAGVRLATLLNEALK